MKILIRIVISCAIFAFIAVAPWFLFEASRLTMRGEAIGIYNIGSTSTAQNIWWLMGLTLILWLPLSLLIAWYASSTFFKRTKAKAKITLSDLARLKEESDKKA